MSSRFQLYCIVAAALVVNYFSSGQVYAEKYDVKLETKITGHSEEPRMIFILPWRHELEVSLAEFPLDELEIGYSRNAYLKPVGESQVIRERVLLEK